MIPANGCHVSPKTSLHVFGNDLIAVFCAENDMNMILRKCVRQSVAPPGLIFSFCHLTHRSRAGLPCFALRAWSIEVQHLLDSYIYFTRRMLLSESRIVAGA